MPDNPNMTDKVIENLNLLHNDLQEVKAVLVKNGITSTGASSKLASEVTKLPEKAEENIKKSTEVKGMLNGTLDITGGFTYSPSESETLDAKNTLISSTMTEYNIPKEKKLGMFFPTDELVSHLESTHDNQSDRNVKLTVNDMNFLQGSYMYLTAGAQNINNINLTIDIKDEYKKVNYKGTEYYDLTQETNSDNDWSKPDRKQFGGAVSLTDYNTKITLNGEVPEKFKCDAFVLSGNKYIKEVVCNEVIVDYRLLKHLFYKNQGLMNDYGEGDTTQYDPIIVKLTGDLSGDFFQGNNYEYKTNELEAQFVRTADPLAINEWTQEDTKTLYFKEQSKNFKGISVKLAEALGKLVHIYIDPSVIKEKEDSAEFILMRLPIYNLDGSKKYNYSNRTWEPVASATPDTKKYYEIYPAMMFNSYINTFKLLGKDKISILFADYKFGNEYSSNISEGIIVIKDDIFGKYNVIAEQNSLWAPSANYSLSSGYNLYSTGLARIESQLKLLNKPITFDVSRTSVAGVYPFGNLSFRGTFDFSINFGYLVKDSDFYDIGYREAFIAAPPFTKFKSMDDVITKITLVGQETPLVYNSTLSKVKVDKVVLPMRTQVFRDIFSGTLTNLYSGQNINPIKYIFEDTGVQVVMPSLANYNEMSDSPTSLVNSPGYRFDSTHNQGSTNFAKYIHCCISETNPAMSDEDFLKYRIPLFNKDETKRYNYSTKQWVAKDSYNVTNDNKLSSELFPTKAEELSKMMVIGIINQ